MRRLLKRAAAAQHDANVVVSCTFTEGGNVALDAHTPEGVGDTWTKHPGTDPTATMHIVAATDRAKADVGLDTVYLASGVPGSAIQDLSATLVQVSESGGAGVVGRFDATAVTGYIGIYEPGNNTFTLGRFDAGVLAVLGTYAQDFADGQSVALRLRLLDGIKTLYVNGVARITSADNTVTAAGRVGLYGYGSAPDSVDAQVADFRAAT